MSEPDMDLLQGRDYFSNTNDRFVQISAVNLNLFQVLSYHRINGMLK